MTQTKEQTERELPAPRARRPAVRARTEGVNRGTKRVLLRVLREGESERQLPATRHVCQRGEHAERPCPFVSCKHHLYLGVSAKTGSIKLNFPGLEVWDLQESCALDVADRGGVTLEAVGVITNLTRERVRQLEERGLAKIRALSELAALQDYVETSPLRAGGGR